MPLLHCRENIFKPPELKALSHIFKEGNLYSHTFKMEVVARYSHAIALFCRISLSIYIYIHFKSCFSSPVLLSFLNLQPGTLQLTLTLRCLLCRAGTAGREALLAAAYSQWMSWPQENPASRGKFWWGG